MQAPVRAGFRWLQMSFWLAGDSFSLCPQKAFPGYVHMDWEEECNSLLSLLIRTLILSDQVPTL